MRALLVCSMGVACTAALALPLALPAGATGVHPPPYTAERAGSTQSLPLGVLEAPDRSRTTPDTPSAQGLPARDVKPFSLVGVIWDDAASELHGQVQVRTRAVGTHRWTPWQELQIHNDDAPDPDSPERRAGKTHGSTAPLWVGNSDGVEVRAVPEAPANRTGQAALPGGLRLALVDPGDDPWDDMGEDTGADTGTDSGMGTDSGTGTDSGSDAGADTGSDPGSGRVEGSGTESGADSSEVPGAEQGDGGGAESGAGRVDTGDGDPGSSGAQHADSSPDESADPPALTPEEAASSAVNAEFAPLGAAEITAKDKAEPQEETENADGANGPAAAAPHIGPRPRIITRAGWGADEKLRERDFAYSTTVKAAFIHHSATGNNYTCAEVPSLLRGIYRYHVESSGWRDFGYNFAIDKCGTIYEGRAGGVARPVMGAHTLGFNSNTMGIAVLGTYTSSNPPAAAVNAVAQLTAWKLGLFGGDPRGKTWLTSAGGDKFKKGTVAKFNVISGHRDGFATECPGSRLYSKLGTARNTAARLQGR
ncbi:N-acetylmuramoyl-L-alanine amidase [Streptomyces sp. NPDC004647]|uniref:peptidoglycan recognition protein family protein n=1 Tax=Streptomyces sp. NPDC004647 TaxID=3154671 RepID=UPI0033AA2880